MQCPVSQLITFTDSQTNHCIHIKPTALIGFMTWYGEDTKVDAVPERTPTGTLVFVEGIHKGILVKENYDEVKEIFTKHGLEC